MMNKLRETRHTWIWTNGVITYKATLYRNTFIVRDAHINGSIILRIKNLTVDSQKSIIENMHNIKEKSKSYRCDSNG